MTRIVREAPYSYTVGLLPGASTTLDAFVATLWNPEGEATPRVKEMVFLRTSMVNRCDT